MFTGLVEAVGSLRESRTQGGDLRLVFETGALSLDGLQLGESIAVSGVCLTVVAFDSGTFAADASNETLALTTLGQLAIGAPVNLERALLPTTRMGGHLVAGHVDGVGRVEATSDDGRSQRWRFSAPRELLRFIAAKGSICVDGVSLTVNVADDSGFEVNLVPHTIAHTAFAHTPVGAPVNLEVDLIARYLERLSSGPRP
jgi:riboflavin synthase